jgi:hypothetical protein
MEGQRREGLLSWGCWRGPSGRSATGQPYGLEQHAGCNLHGVIDTVGGAFRAIQRRAPAVEDSRTAGTPLVGEDIPAEGKATLQIELTWDMGNTPNKLTLVSSISDMTEESSLTLQLAMNARSEFLETLSNLLKALADTQSSILGNLK